MKRTLSILCLAGLSIAVFAGGPVVPPGVQIVGSVESNNVFVSDGLGGLIDSGVAPTNLVVVTNQLTEAEAAATYLPLGSSTINVGDYAGGDGARLNYSGGTMAIGFLGTDHLNMNADGTLSDAGATYSDGSSLLNATSMNARYLQHDGTNAVIAEARNGLAELSVPIAIGSTNKIHILAWGQSNMEGSLGTTTLQLPIELIDAERWSSLGYAGVYLCWYDHAATRVSPQPLTRYTSSIWGPEIWGGIALHQATGKEVYITKMTKGGATISEFLKSGGTYWPRISAAYAAMTNTYPAAGAVDVIWHGQGESGASGGYEANMHAMKTDIKADFGFSDTKLVALGLGASYKSNAVDVVMSGYCATNSDSVYIKNWDLPTHDGTHYTASGQMELGLNAAAASIAFGTDLRASGTSSGAAVLDEGLVTKKGISGASLSVSGYVEGGGLRIAGPAELNGSISRNLTTYLEAPYYPASTYAFLGAKASITDYSFFGSLDNNYIFAVIEGIIHGGSVNNHSLSVKLIDTPYADDAYKWASFVFNGSYSHIPIANQNWSALLSNDASMDKSLINYGTPKFPTDPKKRWIVELSDALTLLEGDLVEAGPDGTQFVVDADNGGASNFVVRIHYNSNDSTGYTAVPFGSNNTPVIVTSSGTPTTNAAAYAVSDTAATDYRNTIYAASDGWYLMVPTYMTAKYEFFGKVPDNWTLAEGD